MDIVYRQGAESDSYRIAELIDQSSSQGISYLYGDIVSKITPLQLCAQILRSDPYYNVNNTLVAEFRRRVIGLTLSFPSSVHVLDEDVKKYFTDEKLAYLSMFFTDQSDDVYYLDAVSVEPDFQGRGIGNELLRQVVEKAKMSGFSLLSLNVFEDNIHAIEWYKKAGFSIFRKVDNPLNAAFPNGSDILVMRKNL